MYINTCILLGCMGQCPFPNGSINHRHWHMTTKNVPPPALPVAYPVAGSQGTSALLQAFQRLVTSDSRNKAQQSWCELILSFQKDERRSRPRTWQDKSSRVPQRIKTDTA